MKPSLPEGPAAASAPLKGLTVIEIGQNVAAPVAGQILGDLGAIVIKVEKRSGDAARDWGPPFWEGSSALFQVLNRNKQSIAVDFRNPEEVAALRELILMQADVVIQNMRPGLLAGLGLGGEALRGEKPALVWCDMGAFGSEGPLADKPGYDPLMQAFGGLMSITGEPGRAPVRTGYSVIDGSTGMWAAIAILAALTRREASGAGCVVDVSLFESALAWMNISAAQYQAGGEVPGRHGSGTAMIVPYRAYRAADEDIVIGAGNDGLFAKLAKVLGAPEWAANERFATNPARVRNRDELDAMIGERIVRQPGAHWIAALEAAGIPVAPIQNIAQALDHPQTKALGIVQNVPQSSMSFVGLPVRFDGMRPEVRAGAPALGAHNAEFGLPHVKEDA
jgi:crotonobetainyl-CoA:carnitine CoA-transferase CaiB-like acyl-CoA transferase